MAYLFGTSTLRPLCLFLFVIFGALTAFTSVQSYRASTSKNWPVTEGVVISFFETPNYRYSVRGESHVNDRVSCNEFVHSSLGARNSAKYAVRYPLDAKVMVHYHPNNPGLAALETTFDPSVFKEIAAFLLVSILCMIGFLRGGGWRLR